MRLPHWLDIALDIAVVAASGGLIGTAAALCAVAPHRPPTAAAFYSSVNVSGPTTVTLRDLQGRVIATVVTSERIGVYVEPVLGPPPPPPPPPGTDPQEAFFPLVGGILQETGEPFATPPRGGERLRILGRGFGKLPGTVRWGVQACTVLTWEEGSVLVQLPAKVTTPNSLSLRRADGRYSSQLVFPR
ncbi:MAG TPA: IPT/TIG domain-containing protein [Gemmatimonadales bacterium]|nr:IPT/TIG domain-containing protein [Gemmatimonadales bacterium]